MKLYYHPLSTYSQTVMVAFNEKGIAYEPQVVDLFSPEGRGAYAKINRDVFLGFIGLSTVLVALTVAAPACIRRGLGPLRPQPRAHPPDRTAE